MPRRRATALLAILLTLTAALAGCLEELSDGGDGDGEAPAPAAPPGDAAAPANGNGTPPANAAPAGAPNATPGANATPPGGDAEPPAAPAPADGNATNATNRTNLTNQTNATNGTSTTPPPPASGPGNATGAPGPEGAAQDAGGGTPGDGGADGAGDADAGADEDTDAGTDVNVTADDGVTVTEDPENGTTTIVADRDDGTTTIHVINGGGGGVADGAPPNATIGNVTPDEDTARLSVRIENEGSEAANITGRLTVDGERADAFATRRIAPGEAVLWHAALPRNETGEVTVRYALEDFPLGPIPAKACVRGPSAGDVNVTMEFDDLGATVRVEPVERQVGTAEALELSDGAARQTSGDTTLGGC